MGWWIICEIILFFEEVIIDNGVVRKEYVESI